MNIILKRKTLIYLIIFLLLPVLFSEEMVPEETTPPPDPVTTYSQKGGMLEKGDHSFYLRTNDEFTGFSTLFAGYRYGLSNWFQFAIEGGIGIKVYIANLHLYFKIFESKNKFFFMGLRTRSGYKYQNTSLTLGSAVLEDTRNGFYIAADYTFSFRFGDERRHSLYYSIYPLFDIDITGRPLEIYFAPIHLGYEFLFKKNRQWSFAIETGYFFPLNDVADTSWFNFPNLANIGFFYRF